MSIFKYFENLSVNPQLQKSCPVPDPPQYPALACSGVTCSGQPGKKALCIHLFLSPSSRPSLSPRLPVCLGSLHRTITHSAMSVFLALLCLSLYLYVSVCGSASLSLLWEPVTVHHSSPRDGVCFLWADARPRREECFENSTWTPHQTTLQLCLASGHHFVHLM